ncbi:MAG: hypothetical protein EBR82_52090 [Caulobacteraceae bacterium]|nr:hypothetical protein [Caulobacteraceae bacterium]
MWDFGQRVPDTMGTPSNETIAMRSLMIQEEAGKLQLANSNAERLDAITNLLVVVVGAAADAGISPETLEAHLVDVLKANHAKKWTSQQLLEKPKKWSASAIQWSDCYAVRDKNGKIRKPPGWTPPDPQRHIDAQRRMEV